MRPFVGGGIVKWRPLPGGEMDKWRPLPREVEVLDNRGPVAEDARADVTTFRVGVWGSGFRAQGSGCRVQGLRFGVWGSGFTIEGRGLRVEGLGLGVGVEG